MGRLTGTLDSGRGQVHSRVVMTMHTLTRRIGSPVSLWAGTSYLAVSAFFRSAHPMSDLPTDHRNDVTFAVRAQRTPDVLPRVLDIFAREIWCPTAGRACGPAQRVPIWCSKSKLAASPKRWPSASPPACVRSSTSIRWWPPAAPIRWRSTTSEWARGLAVRWSLKDRRLRREAASMASRWRRSWGDSTASSRSLVA